MASSPVARLSAPDAGSPKSQRYSSAAIARGGGEPQEAPVERQARAVSRVEQPDGGAHAGRPPAVERAHPAHVVPGWHAGPPRAQRGEARVHVAGGVHQRATPRFVAEAEHVAELVHRRQAAKRRVEAVADHPHGGGHERRRVAGPGSPRDPLAAIAPEAPGARVAEHHARAAGGRAREPDAHVRAVPGPDRLAHGERVARRRIRNRDLVVGPARPRDPIRARRPRQNGRREQSKSQRPRPATH